MDAPTLAGFIAWAQTAMGITTTMLPASSPFFGYAYNVAIALVNQQLAAVPPLYMLAVYNLAGSNLLNWAQDPTPITPYPNASSTVGFFTYTRQQLGLGNLSLGLLTSSSDEGTSAGYQIPAAMQNLSLADLQLLKDPYGRAYLAMAQKAGTLWGLT